MSKLKPIMRIAAVAVACGCAACGSTPERGNPAQAGTAATPAPATAAKPPAAPQHAGVPGQRSAELDVSSARVGGREALAFRVPFTVDSTGLALSPHAQRSLATIALRAEKVHLRDALEGVDPAHLGLESRDERMRIARAFLVGHGVAADRIVIEDAPPDRLLGSKTGGGGGNAAIEILLLLPGT